jgi:hypothetical protein
MKLKALLVAGAVCLASAVNSSAAEVFSANTVGFVNKTVPNGFSMIANPVVAADNSIAALFSSAEVGWQVFKFDASAGTYSTFSFFGAWIGGAESVTVMPGEGVFVYNPGTAKTITFTGEVAQGTASNITLGQGFSIASSVVAQSGLLQTDLGFPAAVGDQVFVFDSGSQTFNTHSFFGTWISSEPTIGVADAFFVNKIAETAWNRNFDPNAGS